MIIEVLLDLLLDFIFMIFNDLLPVGIPAISEDVMSNIYEYLDLFQYAKSFIVFFIPPAVFKFGFTAVSLLFAIEKLYPILAWVLQKIPFLNIR